MRRGLTVTKPARYKAKRRGIKLTRETALAREKRIFHFPHLVSPASLLFSQCDSCFLGDHPKPNASTGGG